MPMSEHSSADNSPAGDSLWHGVYQVRAGRGGGTDRQGRAAGSNQVGAGRRAFPRKRSERLGRQFSADSSPAGDSLWRAVYQVRAGRGGGTDRQACAAERFQVGAGRRAFPRKRPAGAALDTCDILLINKANTASATNAHRVLTNTTGVIGGMAEAIIPNLCPWWIPSRGFLLLNPIRTAKERTGAKWS